MVTDFTVSVASDFVAQNDNNYYTQHLVPISCSCNVIISEYSVVITETLMRVRSDVASYNRCTFILGPPIGGPQIPLHDLTVGNIARILLRLYCIIQQ